PALFTGIAEYPIVLVIACLIRRTPDGASNALPATVPTLLLKDVLPAALLGLFAFGLVRSAQMLGLGAGPEAVGLSLGVPAVVCYLFLMRPVRFALALAALFLAGAWGASQDDVVFASRTYYGLHRVRQEASFNRLS